MILSSSIHVYLDTNFFIAAVEWRGEVSELCKEVLSVGERQRANLYSSELTLAEVLVQPLREGSKALPTIYSDLLTSSARLSIVPVGRAILTEAARLRAIHRSLKLPDAIHLATADRSHCDWTISGDSDLRASASRNSRGVGLSREALSGFLEALS